MYQKRTRIQMPKLGQSCKCHSDRRTQVFEADGEPFVEKGALPNGYKFRKQHTFGAILHVVAALTGATGPA